MTSLNTSLSIKKLSLIIDETNDLIDENIRLKQLDGNKNEIITNLNNLKNNFEKIDSELIYNTNDFLKNKEILEESLQDYNSLIDSLIGYNFKIDDLEKFKIKNLKCISNEIENRKIKPEKSVRFKENLIEPEHIISNNFTPYKDAIGPSNEETLFPTSQSFENSSSDQRSDSSFDNRQLFIDNQQELLQQDSMLESLSGSVRNQRDMGIAINDELDDHLFILHDLERMIDGTGDKLNKGRKKLNKFNEKIKENGRWVTILVLFLILIMLLVLL
ncbi:hypothetical protein PACTADRAFT_185409 [Pachysolen tannophilus NRRL Y-2460]|uniref:t-SNARE coiled-coil homology domain-containing protein n=1 Tax=Pachysolen tannophilus NRRL Y-2460 TaxID=669874 RepID=A0A1E4U2G1_PACTA|nr:hypothetical protein PACTADRAFT_185409 [Pachysolen tannophilus NRRL Y-2460]